MARSHCARQLYSAVSQHFIVTKEKAMRAKKTARVKQDRSFGNRPAAVFLLGVGSFVLLQILPSTLGPNRAEACRCGLPLFGFNFAIDSKIPEQLLLPTPPKSSPGTFAVLTDDLRQVPEVHFQGPIDRVPVGLAEMKDRVKFFESHPLFGDSETKEFDLKD